MTYGDLEDLTARLLYSLEAPRNESRPLALLLGSGVSAPAVRGVTEIIRVVRKYLTMADLEQFDRELAAQETPGLRYQTAFQFLGRRRPPAVRDKIIRAAVLGAYPPARDLNPLPEEMGALYRLECDSDSWTIPRGLEALGRILAGIDPTRRGPILTTNFDPLAELAVRRAGATAESRWMDSDGSFLNSLSPSQSCQVVHLHGFWRESQTLSMTTQLTTERPALSGSLRQLLSRYTVLVAGYSGWLDAFTMQIKRIIDEQSARDLDLLWAHHDPVNAVESERAGNPLLTTLAMAPGNVQMYCGIDVNLLFPNLEVQAASVLNYSDEDRRSARAATLAGWSQVAVNECDSWTESEFASRAVAFFDGHEPSQSDAFNPYIPTRDMSNEVCNQALVEQAACSFTRLLGASGEGKSMVVAQVARLLLEGDPTATVFLNRDGVINDPDAILGLGFEHNYYLLLDNAHRCVNELKVICRALNSRPHPNLHIIAASRDTDWTAAGGDGFAWRSFVTYRPKVLRGVSRPDAVSVVLSWERLGPQALGDLRFVGGRERRISRFLEVAQDYQSTGDGTFFGAVLATRLGDTLTGHIGDLITNLLEHEVTDLNGRQKGTLADALVYVSIAHANGVRTMPSCLLGDLFGLSPAEVGWCLLGPLGDEAPVTTHSDAVVTRHEAIARAVIKCWTESGRDLKVHTKALVRSAVRRIGTASEAPVGLRDVAYISRQIHDLDLAVAAAEAAVEENEVRLSYQARLSSALRNKGDLNGALDVCKSALANAWRAPDRAVGVRSLLNEAGIALGQMGNARSNLYYSALALSDLPNMPLSGDIEHPLSCLAKALCDLSATQHDQRIESAMHGVLYVLGAVPGISLPAEWIAKYRDVVSRSTPPDGLTATRAVEQIAAAVRELGVTLRFASGIDDSLPSLNLLCGRCS